MRYKKILLSIIASVLCLGLLSGCGGYSHDFNSSEEAQKYVLAKLKDNCISETKPPAGDLWNDCIVIPTAGFVKRRSCKSGKTHL